MQSQSQSQEYSAVPLEELAAGDSDRVLRAASKQDQEQYRQEDDSWAASFWPAGIASLTISIPSTSSSESRRAATASSPRPVAAPRWRTREFYVYYAIVLLALYKVIEAPIRLSSDSHPNFWIYEKRLSTGWIPGRKVDNTDAQFRSFRDGFPSLVALALVYLLCARLHAFYLSRYSRSPTSPSSISASRIPFVLASSLVVLVLLHGISSVKILAILYLNFRIPDLVGAESPFTPALTWTFNIAMLFSNELCQGYHFASLWSGLAFLDAPRLAGLKSNWHVNFNICMLRLVSYNMDRYWAARASLVSPSTPSARSSSILADPSEFTWANYLAYILYPPLYLAGPIMTFSSFITQLRPVAFPSSPSSSRHRPDLAKKSILAYTVRFIVCFLTMEIVLHYMYVVAIKDSYVMYSAAGKGGHGNLRKYAWDGDTPFQLAMISLWNLVIVWLKLLLPWRFFRLWALLDGMDPPENMIRCVLNNYSTRGFWRAWHRSYNLWLLRYLYIPVSAFARSTVVGMLVVFTFVALWHDLSLRLLAWGWLTVLFALPEIIASQVLPEKKYGDEAWYRHACAAGAVFNVLMMITTCTIGFVLGLDNTLAFLKQVFGTFGGAAFVTPACIVVYATVQIMFEYREEELRRNIVRKC